MERRTLILMLAAIPFHPFLDKPLAFGRAQPNSPQSRANEITNLISELVSSRKEQTTSAADQKNARQVKKKLLAIANGSGENRREVIDGLIAALKASSECLQIGCDFTLWNVAGDIMSELQAIEAIDYLVAYIIYHKDTGMASLSYRWRPMMRAVVSIGEPAIPKLEEALIKRDLSVAHRKCIAETMGDIGGNLAKQALERALTTEANESVIRQIEISLSSISKDHSKK